jgi:hypothetical protein
MHTSAPAFRDYGSELSTVETSSPTWNAAILTFVSPPRQYN